MEYYFDRDDRLERLKYAKFLETLLLNCDRYRREDSDGAYVIALDSPWGTGKTRFVKMLRNHLEDRTSEAERNRPTGKEDEPLLPGENAKFNVVYYNSWETDYWNDALEPLISSILDSRVFKKEVTKADNKKLRETIVKILKGMGVALAKLALGDACGSVFQGALDGLSEVPNDPLVEYKERTGLYSEFRETLGRVIRRTNKKLVIIIDELDRCRPTFAIQTLELAKHLFAVPGLTFIFALDIDQLSHSVKTVYGAGMDAPGYLCRFFDYTCRIPKPKIRDFIHDRIDDMSFINTLLLNLDKKRRDKVANEIIDFMLIMVKQLTLSLRDITTLLNAYRLLDDIFLSQYKDILAHKIYIFLLAVKYKDPDSFSKLISDISKGSISELQNDLLGTSGSQLYYFVQWMNDKRILGECSFSLKNEDGVDLGQSGKITGVKETGLVTDNRLRVYQLQKDNGRQYTAEIFFSVTDNFGGALFFEDLKKWDQIKHLTLAQYYHRQLEMFDFVLPADEVKTEP